VSSWLHHLSDATAEHYGKCNGQHYPQYKSKQQVYIVGSSRQTEFLGATRRAGQATEDNCCFASASLRLIGISCDKSAHKAVPFGTPRVKLGERSRRRRKRIEMGLRMYILEQTGEHQP